MPGAEQPDEKYPDRKRPAHGVYVSLGQPTVVFLTVSTKGRRPWLAQRHVQAELEKVWSEADAWLVGYYLLMPDHLHLFCAPRDLNVTLKAWVGYWKRQFSCLHLSETGEWQRDYWDTRLRRTENFTNKWRYVQENPVRKGFVTRPKMAISRDAQRVAMVTRGTASTPSACPTMALVDERPPNGAPSQMFEMAGDSMHT